MEPGIELTTILSRARRINHTTSKCQKATIDLHEALADVGKKDGL